MPEAPPKKINPSKFMGASFAAGSKLEEKVENNSKKITLLKNIISLRKKNIDEKIESLKPEETDNNTELMNGLHSVIESLVGVKKVLLDQVKGRIVERKNLRLQNERQSKKRREDELEKGKDGDDEKETKGIVKAAESVFDRIKKFLTSVLLGAATIKLLEWFKDPENSKKLTAFGEFLDKHGGTIIKTLIALTALSFIGGLGTLFTLGKSISGIIGLLVANPIVAGILGLGVATVVAGNWLIGKQIQGGKVIREGRKRVVEEFRNEVIASNERLMSDSPDTPLLDANSGLLVYPKGHEKEYRPILTLNYYGNKGWKGKADEYDDPTGESTGRKKNITPGEFRADGNTWGTLEQVNLVFKKEKALDEIGEPGKGIQKEMWDKIREKRLEVWKKIKDERANSQKLENIRSLPAGAERAFKLKEYENETLRMKKEAQNAAEEQIKEEYTGKLGKLVDEAFTGPTLTEKEMYDYYRAQPNMGFPRIEKYEKSDTSSNINESIGVGGKAETIAKLKEQKKNLNLWDKLSGVGGQINEEIYKLETGKEMNQNWKGSYERKVNEGKVGNILGGFEDRGSTNDQEVSTNKLRIDSNSKSAKDSSGIESKVSSNKTPKINLLPLTANNESGPTSGSGAFGNDSVIFSSEDPNGTGSEFAVAGIYNVTST